MQNPGAAYAGITSYQDNASIRQEVDLGRAKQNVEFSSTLFFAKPNKLNLHLKAAVQEVAIVCDGKTLWSWATFGELSQYTVREAPKTFDDILNLTLSEDPVLWCMLFTMNLYRVIANEDPAAALIAHAQKFQVEGGERLDEGAMHVLSWEQREKIPPSLTRFGSSPISDVMIPIKIWVSKKSGLIAQMSIDIASTSRLLHSVLSRGSTGPAGIEIKTFRLTETHSDIKLNGPLAPDVFSFTPPDKAKLVDRFTIYRKVAGLPDVPEPLRDPTQLKILRRDPKTSAKQIDLSRFYNELLAGFLGENPENNLSSLPAGLQKLDGIDFDIRGVVHLSSLYARDVAEYPRELKAIPVNQAAARIHFLHASHWVIPTNGTPVAKYVVNYRDGQKREFPVNYGQHIRDWWHDEKDSPNESTVAWTGTNPTVAKRGGNLHLFRAQWTNPSPNLEVASIDFRSAMNGPAPFLIAITVE